MKKYEKKKKDKTGIGQFEISKKVNRWKGVIESDMEYKELMKEIFKKKYEEYLENNSWEQ